MSILLRILSQTLAARAHSFSQPNSLIRNLVNCRKNLSLKVEDYEPAFALRKIALYYEKNMNEDVAKLIREVSLGTLKKIYSQFPIDMFIDGIPQTLTIVTTLYSRLLSAAQLNGFEVDLPYKSLLMQIVKLRARNLATDLPKLRDWERLEKQCDQLLQVIGKSYGVGSMKMLRSRRSRLQHAVDGLVGEHGMVEVETSLISSKYVESRLMPLSLALGVELERMIDNCKISINKLTSRDQRHLMTSSDNNQSASSSSSSSEFIECNHQRILNLTSANIQDRLYKNKALLNVVEPTMNYAQLPKLVDILHERIEHDKQVLSTFFDLRRDIVSVCRDSKLLPTLTSYLQAFTLVIDNLKNYVVDDVTTPEESMLSCSTMNTSTKSSNNPTPPPLPTTSPTTTNQIYHQSMEKMRREGERLREEVREARMLIDRLSKRQINNNTTTKKREESSAAPPSGDETRLLGEELTRLYDQSALDMLDVLEPTWDDADSETIIKSKVLFSVIVVSFRSAVDTFDKINYQLHQITCSSNSESRDGSSEEKRAAMEQAFGAYLRATTSTYDVSANVQLVHRQLCEALHDHPRLPSCPRFLAYVRACVRLSWRLACHLPALALDYDSEIFDPHVHRRHAPTSSSDSNLVIAFLWPALLLRETGRCVTHALVITG